MCQLHSLAEIHSLCRDKEKTRQERIQLNSPILLKLGANAGFCEKMIVARKAVEKWLYV